MKKTKILNKANSIVCFIIVFGLLAGCSNLKSYSTNLANNFSIKLDKNSDSGVEGRVDVYLLDKHCDGPYQGSYWTSKKTGKIGLKVNHQTLLIFNFLSSHWLKGKHSNGIEALVRPLAGYRYVAHMSYIDDAFDLEIFEINRKTKKQRPIDIIGLSSCKSD